MVIKNDMIETYRERKKASLTKLVSWDYSIGLVIMFGGKGKGAFDKRSNEKTLQTKAI